MRGRGGEAGRRATRGARGGAAPFGRDRGLGRRSPEWGGGVPPQPLLPRAPCRPPRAPAPPTSLPLPREGGGRGPPAPGDGPLGSPASFIRHPAGWARPLAVRASEPGSEGARGRATPVRRERGRAAVSSAGCAWYPGLRTSVAEALPAGVTRRRRRGSTWPSVCARVHTHACSFAASCLVGPVLFPVDSANTPVDALWY